MIILKNDVHTDIEVSSNNSRDAPNDKMKVGTIFDTTNHLSDTSLLDCKTRKIKFEIKNYKHIVKKHVFV